MKQIVIGSLVIGLCAAIYWAQSPQAFEQHEPVQDAHQDVRPSHEESAPNTQAQEREPTPPKLDEQQPSPTEQEKRDEFVQKKLDAFIKKTAHISEATVAHERERIAQGLQQAQQRPTAQPQVTRELDKSGQAWEKLEFSDGIVRYVPAVAEEQSL